MIHKIKSIKAKDNFILEATFLEGTTKRFDVRELFPLFPQMEVLKDAKLFDKVQVDAGGYGVSWTDELDLSAETIWEQGVFVKKEMVSPVLEMAYKVAAARETVGMTQKQLADKTGIYQADISKIESGRGNPSVKTLSRLAKGLGMNLEFNFTTK